MHPIRYLLPLLLSFLFLLPPPAKGQSADLKLLQKVNSWDNPTAIAWSKGLSDSDMVLMVGVPTALGLYGWIADDEATLESALVVGASVLSSGAITWVLKKAINRPRPYEAHPHLITPYTTEGSASFPSGHTSIAFALATSLSLEYPRWYVAVPAFLWATGVGYSRMHLGVHYPSDVLCGALLGAGSSYLSHWLMGQWRAARSNKVSPHVAQQIACYEL